MWVPPSRFTVWFFGCRASSSPDARPPVSFPHFSPSLPLSSSHICSRRRSSWSRVSPLLHFGPSPLLAALLWFGFLISLVLIWMQSSYFSLFCFGFFALVSVQARSILIRFELFLECCCCSMRRRAAAGGPSPTRFVWFYFEISSVFLYFCQWVHVDPLWFVLVAGWFICVSLVQMRIRIQLSRRSFWALAHFS